MWHCPADCFFDLGNDRNVGSNNYYIVFRMIDNIAGNQIGFPSSSRLYNGSDPVCFESFLDGPVSRFIMWKQFNMLSRFQAFQIAIIRNSQSMQFKGKCLRKIASMSQDTKLITAAHFSDTLHFSILSIHFRQANRFLIPYLFHNESNGILPKAYQQTAGFFSDKIMIRMIKIAEWHSENMSILGIIELSRSRAWHGIAKAQTVSYMYLLILLVLLRPRVKHGDKIAQNW